MTEATTMTVETTEPAKAAQIMPADLRGRLVEESEKAKKRDRITEEDKAWFGELQRLADGARVTYDNSDAWNRVKTQLQNYIGSTQANQVVELSDGSRLEIPVVQNQIVRERLAKSAQEIITAIDTFVKLVNDAAEREAEQLSRKVGIVRQLIESHPIAGPLIAARRAAWKRRTDPNAKFDPPLVSYIDDALGRLVGVEQIPLHVHELGQILPAVEAQEKADETAKAAEAQRSKRSR